MPSSPGEIDWDDLKQDAPVSTRVALDHLERLSRFTAGRLPPGTYGETVPHASMAALIVATVATVRVLFGVVVALLLAPAATYAVPPWVITSSAVVFCAGGLVLWVGGLRDWRARHLGLAYLTIAAAFIDLHLGWVADNSSPSIAFTAYGLRALATESFLPFFVVAFVEAFPRVARDSWAQRVLVALKRAALVLGVALASISAVAWLWPVWTGGRAPLEVLRPWLPMTPSPALFWLAVFTVVAPALLMIVVKMRDSRGKERQRAQLLLGSVIFALLPFLLALLILNTTTLLNSVERIRTAAVVVYAALLTLPPTTAYAVLTRGALDVRVLARSAAHYALARWVLMTATVAPLLITAVLAYDYRTQTLESMLQLPFARGLLITAAAALALTIARMHVLKAIDRLFLRSAIDTETLVAELGERTRRLPSAHDVGRDVAATIAPAFAVEHATVMVRDQLEQRFESLGADLSPLKRGSALVDLASAGDDVFTTEQPTPIAGLLPYEDQMWLANTGVEALLPLRGRGDRLIGLVALGHRRGDWTYTSRERQTLKAVAAAVAPVLERHLEARSGPGVLADRDDALLVCIDCGVIHKAGAGRCPCGGTIEGGVIPRTVGGKYEVTRRLGRGAMGVVFEARDLALDRLVAVKALPHLSFREGERLVQEARRMTKVTHPNLAYVIGLETFNGMPLVVMEHLAGRTLRDRIARGPLPVPEVVRIGSALCDALYRLHQAGLLHRDVKPGNVGFDGEGTPKLLDFGLALPIEITRATAVSLAGTPLYLPPEAWHGYPADHYVDLWGLAMTLYEALSGSHPLAGLAAADLQAGAAAGAGDAVRANLSVSTSVAAVFAKAFASEPDYRYKDAAALREALASLYSSTAGRISGITEQTT